MKLSKNYTSEELTRSTTAQLLHINNEPSVKILATNVLQPFMSFAIWVQSYIFLCRIKIKVTKKLQKTTILMYFVHLIVPKQKICNLSANYQTTIQK